jgi:hypothetical protein
MAFDTESLPLIDFLLCTNPTTCQSVAPHSSHSVRVEDLPCCTRETSGVTIVHYHLVPVSGGGFRADSVRQIAVDLEPLLP